VDLRVRDCPAPILDIRFFGCRRSLGMNPSGSGIHLCPGARAKARARSSAVVDPRRTAGRPRPPICICALPGTDVAVAIHDPHDV